MGRGSLSRDCCIREAAGCKQKEFFLLGNYTLLVHEVWFPSPQHPLFFPCQETPVPHSILGSFHGTQTCMRQTAGAPGWRGRERMGDFRTYQVTNSNGVGWQFFVEGDSSLRWRGPAGLSPSEEEAIPESCAQSVQAGRGNGEHDWQVAGGPHTCVMWATRFHRMRELGER